MMKDQREQPSAGSRIGRGWPPLATARRPDLVSSTAQTSVTHMLGACSDTVLAAALPSVSDDMVPCWRVNVVECKALPRARAVG